jgi:hypothetical protein
VKGQKLNSRENRDRKKDIVEKTHVLMNHVKSPSKVTQFSSLPSEKAYILATSPLTRTTTTSHKVFFYSFKPGEKAILGQKIDEQLKV